MFTIFDCFQLIGRILGIFCGFTMGQRHFGLVGGMAGAILGLIIGFYLGSLPFIVCYTAFGTRSTKRLRQCFGKDQYYIFHLALANLMSRGEDVSCYKGQIVKLLASDNLDRKKFDWASVQVAYLDGAEQLTDFNPEAPTTTHAETIRKLQGEVTSI
ncbi:MAG TPA: hypothetical protein VM821_07475, partial [Abditibacteriaceae bacterium]|nr:hypothetical protein [Abditibacteriaceae bacterium]